MGAPEIHGYRFQVPFFSTCFNARFDTCFQNWIQGLISWSCSATGFESVFESRFQYAVQRLAGWILGLIVNDLADLPREKGMKAFFRIDDPSV